jgi:broad specificity phosphatase PhoE
MSEPEITPLLREVDYGSYEGLTTTEIRATRPGWELYRDGSPGGETPADIQERARAFITFVTAGRTEGRAIAFAHGHILRAVAVAWIAAGIELAVHLQLDVATLSVLAGSGQDRLVALWNAP